jgi:hypothetical protein
MNVEISNGEFMVDKFDMFVGLLQLGFTIGVVVFVIAAAAKIGWKIAPYALGAALLAWLFL